MSGQDKQFVDAVRRWRSADEKDVRIAALEAENAKLREECEYLTEENIELKLEIYNLRKKL